jgi:hypothetical protein
METLEPVATRVTKRLASLRARAKAWASGVVDARGNALVGPYELHLSSWVAKDEEKPREGGLRQRITLKRLPVAERTSLHEVAQEKTLTSEAMVTTAPEGPAGSSFPAGSDPPGPVSTKGEGASGDASGRSPPTDTKAPSVSSETVGAVSSDGPPEVPAVAAGASPENLVQGLAGEPVIVSVAPEAEHPYEGDPRVREAFAKVKPGAQGVLW